MSEKVTSSARRSADGSPVAASSNEALTGNSTPGNPTPEKPAAEKPSPETSTSVDPFARAENEDDDGYDPYSDRRPKPEPLFESDPWS